MFGFEGPSTFIPDAPSPSPSFFLVSAQPRGMATVRLRFSIPPLAESASEPNDALNPDNYSLAGPKQNYVRDVVAVDGDQFSFDLFLAAPLAVGSWKLTAKSIVDANSIETI